ncbi:hypothetical protein FOZ62_000117 [Perkinsus olseni]|uniref:Uncharacterized protein n=1 Tax=Perkinsus olseni TaxID=32597 RepID=A0A7J6R0T4_PEROL|nr:hypothetical protein FOZ62_000117 [Perkinsus olseni]
MPSYSVTLLRILSHMTSTPLILSTAVGLLSSLPFGVAMRAAAPNAAHDGYPSLGYAEVGWMASTVDCYYRHGEDGEDTLASLEFKVTQSAELRTTAVTCLKA